MQLSPYVDELQQQLLVSAEAGGDDARQLAERLLPPLQSASRLVLLDALTAAAAEITTDLAPGSVELRLRGRDAEFVVDPGSGVVPLPEVPIPSEPVAPLTAADTAASLAGDTDEAGTARMTLRLPEALKGRIEAAASRDGLSVNAWLVRNLSAVVEPGSRGPDHRDRRTPSGGARFTGWAHS